MAEPLKNQYDPAFLARVADVVGSCAPGKWDRRSFLDHALGEGWEDLELKARMRRISESLRIALPDDYLEALPILREAATEFDGYLSLFFPDFVEQYGLAHWDASVDALHWMTRFGTAELAVRPFLKADAPRMLATMRTWCDDPNEHVRRLASEGCRPRLPWAMNLPAFQADPSPLVPILTALRTDPSEYVRRSVANNLNDIAKDHPSLTLELATAWKGTSPEVDRLVKHACRTLLRSGDARAMRLFGFRDPADLQLVDLALDSDRIPLGEVLTFAFTLESPDALGKVRLEYRIDFARPHGRGARKMFQISESTSEDRSRRVTRKHGFVDRSTRKHYAGWHHLTVYVNGVAKGDARFELIP